MVSEHAHWELGFSFFFVTLNLCLCVRGGWWEWELSLTVYFLNCSSALLRSLVHPMSPISLYCFWFTSLWKDSVLFLWINDINTGSGISIIVPWLLSELYSEPLTNTICFKFHIVLKKEEEERKAKEGSTGKPLSTGRCLKYYWFPIFVITFILHLLTDFVFRSGKVGGPDLKSFIRQFPSEGYLPSP